MGGDWKSEKIKRTNVHLKTVDEVAKVAGVGLVEFVRSENSHRRHLSPAQSAAIVIKHSKMLTVGDNQYSNEGETRVPPKSSKEVAKEAGVNEKTVRRAKQALSVAPEKAEAMISGKTTPTKVISGEKSVRVERIDSILA